MQPVLGTALWTLFELRCRFLKLNWLLVVRTRGTPHERGPLLTPDLRWDRPQALTGAAL